MADITNLSSTGWRKFKGGLKSWTGSLEVYTDGTNVFVPSDVGASAQLKLYVNSTNYLVGDAICSAWHPAVSVDGVQTQTMDFQGNSDLSYT